MKKLFNQDKYLKYFNLGYRGDKLAKKLGYSSKPALSRAKREHERALKERGFIDIIKVTEELRKKKNKKRRKHNKEKYEASIVASQEKAKQLILENEIEEQKQREIEEQEREQEEATKEELDVSILENIKEHGVTLDSQAEDIVKFIEKFTKTLINSINIDNLEDKDKLYASSSFAKTMTTFIVEIMKLSASK